MAATGFSYSVYNIYIYILYIRCLCWMVGFFIVCYYCLLDPVIQLSEDLKPHNNRGPRIVGIKLNVGCWHAMGVGMD